MGVKSTGLKTWRGVCRGVAALSFLALSACGAERPAAPPSLSGPELGIGEGPRQPAEEVVPSGRCSLPQVPAGNLNCWKQAPELLHLLEEAMTAATVAQPDNFDFDSLRCGTCYYVKDHEAYYAEVARQLQLRGVCSQQDRDEITLKVSNGWSEQFDIMLASSHMRRGEGSYLYTCSPSMF